MARRSHAVRSSAVCTADAATVVKLGEQEVVFGEGQLPTSGVGQHRIPYLPRQWHMHNSTQSDARSETLPSEQNFIIN